MVPDHSNSKMSGGADDGLLFTYYVSDQRPLELSFYVDANVKPQLELLESSFDLLENPLLKVKSRPSSYMPKPFLVNDAIIVRKKITGSRTLVVPIQPTARPTYDTIPAENQNG